MITRTSSSWMLTVLPAVMSGCGWWGTTDSPCDLTYTCDPPIDAAADARAATESSVGDGAAAGSGDDAADSGALLEDSSGLDETPTDSAADAGPAAEEDLDGADRMPDACDLRKTPSEAPCTVDERFGVFVSPSSVDAGADGTRAHPDASLMAALRRAKVDSKRVYVCDDGTGYSEKLTVDATLDGLQVFGGFECSTWTYSTSHRTKVTTQASPVLTITKLTAGITIADLEIDAPDGAIPGGSSIGVLVDESSGVVLRRVRVASGKGRDGSAGENENSSSSTTGANGNNGAAACSASSTFGGRTAITLCGGLEASSGGVVVTVRRDPSTMESMVRRERRTPPGERVASVKRWSTAKTGVAQTEEDRTGRMVAAGP